MTSAVPAPTSPHTTGYVAPEPWNRPSIVDDADLTMVLALFEKANEKANEKDVVFTLLYGPHRPLIVPQHDQDAVGALLSTAQPTLHTGEENERALLAVCSAHARTHKAGPGPWRIKEGAIWLAAEITTRSIAAQYEPRSVPVLRAVINDLWPLPGPARRLPDGHPSMNIHRELNAPCLTYAPHWQRQAIGALAHAYEPSRRLLALARIVTYSAPHLLHEPDRLTGIYTGIITTRCREWRIREHFRTLRGDHPSAPTRPARRRS